MPSPSSFIMAGPRAAAKIEADVEDIKEDHLNHHRHEDQRTQSQSAHSSTPKLKPPGAPACPSPHEKEPQPGEQRPTLSEFKRNQ